MRDMSAGHIPRQMRNVSRPSVRHARGCSMLHLHLAPTNDLPQSSIHCASLQNKLHHFNKSAKHATLYFLTDPWELEVAHPDFSTAALSQDLHSANRRTGKAVAKAVIVDKCHSHCFLQSSMSRTAPRTQEIRTCPVGRLFKRFERSPSSIKKLLTPLSLFTHLPENQLRPLTQEQTQKKTPPLLP